MVRLLGFLQYLVINNLLVLFFIIAEFLIICFIKRPYVLPSCSFIRDLDKKELLNKML